MNRRLPIARALLPLFMLATAAGCARATDLKPVEPPVLEGTTTLALGSCADQEKDQGFWDSIAAHEPELFLFMGDNVYGDVADHGKIAMPELGLAYAQLSGHPEFQRFRKKIPILPTWDDHDYACGDCGADFLLKEDAERIFEGFWGVPSDDPRATRPGIYFSRMHESHGKRVHIILLDARFFRSKLKPSKDKSQKGAERYLPSDAKDQAMLGKEQWAWLESELKKEADLRVLVSGVQVLAEDHGYECWRNLPAERDRLLTLLAQTQTAPLIILSGDRHMAALYRKDVAGAPLYELTSSSLNIATNLRPQGFAAPQVTPYFTEPNYGLLRVHWPTNTLRVLLYASFGDLLYQHQLTLPELGGSAPAP